MPPELSREEERRGIRRIMLGGSIVAAILLIAFSVWPLLVPDPLGTPPGGAKPSAPPEITTGKGAPAQRSAESTVGKNDPAGLEDPTGGRARQIKKSSRPLQLGDNQRQELKQILAKQNLPKINRADFELMIGAAVPEQVPLQDLPPEISQMLNGYWGDQCVVVGDMLVIVDQHSRRVVAIIPEVA